MRQMKTQIEIVIDDAMLDGPVKKAVSDIVIQRVNSRVQEWMSRYQDTIDDSIRAYLEKRLTDKDVKDHIDKSVTSIIKDRLLD